MSKHMTQEYTAKIQAKVYTFFPNECYAGAVPDQVERRLKEINSKKYNVMAVRMLLNGMLKEGLIDYETIRITKAKLNQYHSKADINVPSDQEVHETLSKLDGKARYAYLLLLCSGLRLVEAGWILNRRYKEFQRQDGFVKVVMNNHRGQKTANHCYCPTWLWRKLQPIPIETIKTTLKRKNGIAAKYCRKWFYTKCIELGIPDTIADYYQGRTGNSVGSRHYLSRQYLADKYYKTKLVNYLKKYKKA